jgi:Na+-driven multidrug efflux pump
MIFRDRTEAGKHLATKLLSYKDRQDVLVLALPRGGVPVAFEVAQALRVPLDIFLVASGLIFVNSSMFQAMGNTIPSLLTSSLRILLVAIPAVILSRMAGFDLAWVWYLSVFSVFVQLALSMYLLRREFGRRLNFEVPVTPVPTIPEPAVPG